MGYLADHRHGLHGQEHHQQRSTPNVPRRHRHRIAAHLPSTVRSGPLHRSLLRHRHREWTGPWAEKHCLCRVDCLYLSEPAFSGWPRLLHPVAERHQ